ncbi:MAG: carbamoyltransferase C-terminal domain-containing protein [Pseudomonadota bacterium]
MKIIGWSGFENAMAFKQEQFPGLDLREYRIVQGQDSAAALIVDGEIVAAAAEERFNGQKHSGAFPVGAIRYCCAEAGIDVRDVDAFVHAFDYGAYRVHHSRSQLAKLRYQQVYSRDALLGLFERSLPEVENREAKVHHLEHHIAHAASAYYTSGWDECLVGVLDGMGEVHSITLWHARDGKMEAINKQSADNSLGVLYSLVTLHLGFDFNSDEYKIMGLAPYGDPAKYRGFFDEHVELLDNGTLRIQILSLNKTADQREIYAATRDYLTEHLIAPRDPDEDITDAHRDVAAALQECLNKAIHHIGSHFAGTTGLRRLAMAGGVALNCTANGKLLDAKTFDEIYVQPAAADDGAGLGAALAHAASHDRIDNQRMVVPFLGPAYEASELEREIERHGDSIEVERFGSFAETCAAAAKCIAEGKVIAWFRGRMEFGPRALGNRSILADPGNPEMRDRVNAMVKMREAFRPFAPAVTLETAHEWFEIEPGTELPYMIFIVRVREAHREALPAITHVDGTARVQTVAAETNPEFHALLKQVGQTTGREMVLNTSFNVKGQPMVNTPKEAIDTFLGTGIDILFLGDNAIRRASAKT